MNYGLQQRIKGSDFTLRPFQLYIDLQKLIKINESERNGAPVFTRDFPIRDPKRVRSAKFSWQNLKLVQSLKNVKIKKKYLTTTNFKTRFLLQQLAELRIQISSVVKKFYFAQGCRYLQVQNYGLFYVGPGACPYGIPSFEPCTSALRLKVFSWKRITLALLTNKKAISFSSFSLDPMDKRTFPVGLFTKTKKLHK